LPRTHRKRRKSNRIGKKLYEVVKELSEREVTCRLRENQWIEILCGKSNFKILGLAAESFPSLPTYEEEGFVDIKAHPFREMIEKTIYAVSNDETRYNLRGLFLIQQGKRKREGTADGGYPMGYRISMVDRNFDQEMKGLEKGILLPRKGMAELNRLIDEGAETIKIKIKNNNFIVRKDSVVLIMRLLDAEFPDYQQVIPVKTKRQIRMRREKFLEALRRVALLSSEKTRGVKFHFSKDTLELSPTIQNRRGQRGACSGF
jgi:DNA polymerase-3 subunit beta